MTETAHVPMQVQIRSERDLASLTLGCFKTLVRTLREKPDGTALEEEPLYQALKTLRAAFAPHGDVTFKTEWTSDGEIVETSVAGVVPVESLRGGTEIVSKIDLDGFRGSTVGSSSQVVLPDDFAGQLAEAFANLPTPQVTVENVVNVPDVDDGPQTIRFDRDRQGRITDAVIEAA